MLCCSRRLSPDDFGYDSPSLKRTWTISAGCTPAEVYHSPWAKHQHKLNDNQTAFISCTNSMVIFRAHCCNCDAIGPSCTMQRKSLSHLFA